MGSSGTLQAASILRGQAGAYDGYSYLLAPKSYSRKVLKAGRSQQEEPVLLLPAPAPQVRRLLLLRRVGCCCCCREGRCSKLKHVGVGGKAEEAAPLEPVLLLQQLLLRRCVGCSCSAG